MCTGVKLKPHVNFYSEFTGSIVLVTPVELPFHICMSAVWKGHPSMFTYSFNFRVEGREGNWLLCLKSGWPEDWVRIPLLPSHYQAASHWRRKVLLRKWSLALSHWGRDWLAIGYLGGRGALLG